MVTVENKLLRMICDAEKAYESGKCRPGGGRHLEAAECGSPKCCLVGASCFGEYSSTPEVTQVASEKYGLSRQELRDIEIAFDAGAISRSCPASCGWASAAYRFGVKCSKKMMPNIRI